jgi:glycosyltransferase involved in cell wall biosynthesis
MTADTVGGVFSYTLTLAEALSPLPITLATMGAPLSAAQRAELARLPHVAVEESAFKLEWMAEPWDDLARAGDWLRQIAARTEPDLVHLNQYAFGALDWDLPTVVVGHSCVLSWWRAVRGGEAPPEWDRYREVVRRGLQSATRVAAPSEAMLASLERDHGPLPPGRAIWNARASEWFHPQTKQPVILAAGRVWDEAKNLSALDRIAARLPWPVCIAGDTRHPDGGAPELRQVKLLGSLSPRDMARAFGEAAIYALPARYEPFGLSILEAALSGCALVLGDLPSLRELWDGAACFVDPGDEDALAAALRALIDEPLRQRAAAEAALSRARRYRPQAMAQAYRELYRSALVGEAACA